MRASKALKSPQSTIHNFQFRLKQFLEPLALFLSICSEDIHILHVSLTCCFLLCNLNTRWRGGKFCVQRRSLAAAAGVLRHAAINHSPKFRAGCWKPPRCAILRKTRFTAVRREYREMLSRTKKRKSARVITNSCTPRSGRERA